MPPRHFYAVFDFIFSYCIYAIYFYAIYAFIFAIALLLLIDAIDIIITLHCHWYVIDAIWYISIAFSLYYAIMLAFHYIDYFYYTFTLTFYADAAAYCFIHYLRLSYFAADYLSFLLSFTLIDVTYMPLYAITIFTPPYVPFIDAISPLRHYLFLLIAADAIVYADAFIIYYLRYHWYCLFRVTPCHSFSIGLAVLPCFQ